MIGVQILELSVTQLRFEGQFGHADNAVQRCANFMAHVGQKFAFGAVGRFGGFFGLIQFQLVCLRTVMSRANAVKSQLSSIGMAETVSSTGNSAPDRFKAVISIRRFSTGPSPVSKKLPNPALCACREYESE